MRVTKSVIVRMILTAASCLLLSSAQAQTSGSYISNHKAIAAVLSYVYGIPEQLILAVATVESSSGKGPAARVLNNHFGIEGKNYYATPSGFKSRYKQYANVFASYLDFCLLLTRKHFYNRLKDNDDCTAWIKAMSRAHYSEVPQEWEHKVFTALAAVQKQAAKESSPLLATTR